MDLAQAYNVVLSAILFVLPAYIANATPLVLARFLRRRRPIDRGKTLKWDGRRILGDSKSIEGFVAGVAAGTITGLALGYPLKGFLMGLGAMTGDVLGSFIKRRLNIKPGEPAIGLDQYLFVLFALLLSFAAGYSPTSTQLLVILIATPILHLSSNIVAGLIKVKPRPLP